jgi:hypothetical protein
MAAVELWVAGKVRQVGQGMFEAASGSAAVCVSVIILRNPWRAGKSTTPFHQRRKSMGAVCQTSGCARIIATDDSFGCRTPKHRQSLRFACVPHSVQVEKTAGVTQRSSAEHRKF